MCGALTYAELAGMFPKAGGDYQFLKAAYGSWAGFLIAISGIPFYLFWSRGKAEQSTIPKL